MLNVLPGRATNATIESVKTVQLIGMFAKIVTCLVYVVHHHLLTTNVIVFRMQVAWTLLDTAYNVMMVVTTASNTSLTIVTVTPARAVGMSQQNKALVQLIGKSARQHAPLRIPNLVGTVLQAPLIISCHIISTFLILHIPTPALATPVLLHSQ